MENGSKAHYRILIVGGGTAGLSLAAALSEAGHSREIGIVEPSEVHYYQPIWTLVGAGVFPKEHSARPEADYIPKNVTWIKGAVVSFQPERNAVTLLSSQILTYEVLVVAAGIKLDWERVPGLKDSVGVPGTGVCSNYDYHTVDATWENIRSLRAGKALFTHPSGPMKCGGAPMKIAFLAADYWRRQGVLANIEVKLYKPGKAIFAIDKYRPTFERVADRYGIERVWSTDLIEIRPDRKEAVFRHRETEEETVEEYDMIHVTPYQTSPDFIRQSPLANDYGWVEVDQYTTQHVSYANVFALGDCSSLPTSKTGAAIRKQVPVTVANLKAFLAGEPLAAKYDGYTSCPVVTGFGKLVMAEFDYEGQPCETFPFDQSEERYSMYALKAYGLPRLYWHGMLRGREF